MILLEWRYIKTKYYYYYYYIVCVGGANRFVHADHLMATSVTDETVRRDAPGSTQPIATTPPSANTQLNTTIQPSVTTLPCVTSHPSVTTEENTRAAAAPTRRCEMSPPRANRVSPHQCRYPDRYRKPVCENRVIWHTVGHNNTPVQLFMLGDFWVILTIIAGAFDICLLVLTT